MTKVVFNRNFLKSAKKIPSGEEEKLNRLISLLEENPYHPLLHTKHLTGRLTGYLSFRITRDWRVIFQFLDPQTIQLLRVAHRSEIYR